MSSNIVKRASHGVYISWLLFRFSFVYLSVYYSYIWSIWRGIIYGQEYKTICICVYLRLWSHVYCLTRDNWVLLQISYLHLMLHDHDATYISNKIVYESGWVHMSVVRPTQLIFCAKKGEGCFLEMERTILVPYILCTPC